MIDIIFHNFTGIFGTFYKVIFTLCSVFVIVDTIIFYKEQKRINGQVITSGSFGINILLVTLVGLQEIALTLLIIYGIVFNLRLFQNIPGAKSLLADCERLRDYYINNKKYVLIDLGYEKGRGFSMSRAIKNEFVYLFNKDYRRYNKEVEDMVSTIIAKIFYRACVGSVIMWLVGFFFNNIIDIITNFHVFINDILVNLTSSALAVISIIIKLFLLYCFLIITGMLPLLISYFLAISTFGEEGFDLAWGCGRLKEEDRNK